MRQRRHFQWPATALAPDCNVPTVLADCSNAKLARPRLSAAMLQSATFLNSTRILDGVRNAQAIRALYRLFMSGSSYECSDGSLHMGSSYGLLAGAFRMTLHMRLTTISLHMNTLFSTAGLACRIDRHTLPLRCVCAARCIWLQSTLPAAHSWIQPKIRVF